MDKLLRHLLREGTIKMPMSDVESFRDYCLARGVLACGGAFTDEGEDGKYHAQFLYI